MLRSTITAIALTAVAVSLFVPGFAPGGTFGAHALRFLLVAYVLVPLVLLAVGPHLPFRKPPGGGVGLRIAIGVFAHAGALALAFLPATYDIGARSPLAAVAIAVPTLVLLFFAWWCVCAPAGSPWRLPDPAAMARLFLMGVPHQLTFGPIAVAARPLYEGVTVADQRAGAITAWVPGGLLLWVAITLVWIRWNRRERGAAGNDDAPPLTIPGGTGGGASE